MISRRLISLVTVLIASVFSTTTHAETPRMALVKALIVVESNGNDRAIGDLHLAQKAYGCLQARQPVCDDINRRYGTNYRAEDCLGNRELSMKLCRLYIAMYATEKKLGQTPTDEDIARIWNGGPSGWKRSSTVKYWKKVKDALEGKTPPKVSKKSKRKK